MRLFKLGAISVGILFVGAIALADGVPVCRLSFLPDVPKKGSGYFSLVTEYFNPEIKRNVVPDPFKKSPEYFPAENAVQLTERLIELNDQRVCNVRDWMVAKNQLLTQNPFIQKDSLAKAKLTSIFNSRVQFHDGTHISPNDEEAKRTSDPTLNPADVSGTQGFASSTGRGANGSLIRSSRDHDAKVGENQRKPMDPLQILCFAAKTDRNLAQFWNGELVENVVSVMSQMEAVGNQASQGNCASIKFGAPPQNQAGSAPMTTLNLANGSVVYVTEQQYNAVQGAERDAEKSNSSAAH